MTSHACFYKFSIVLKSSADRKACILDALINSCGTSHEDYENSIRKEKAEGEEEDTSNRSLTELRYARIFARIAFIDT